MCYSPTLIKNPNYGKKGGFSFLKDCVSQYIPVPCGHCGECVALRTSSAVQRCELEAVYGWPFYCTLTYNEEMIPRHTCSDGVRIRYADWRDVTNMIKRLRASNVFGRPFRYFGVTELGSKRGRPHVHLLLFLKRLPDDNIYTPINLERIGFDAVLHEWRRNVATRLSKRGNVVPDNVHPDYRPLCTYIVRYIHGVRKSTYDFKYIVPSPMTGTSEDVSFYITKYLFKDSDQKDRLKSGLKLNLPPEEFRELWNKIKPRSFSSLNFGFGYYGDLNPRTTLRCDRLAILKDLPSSDYVRASIARSLRSEDVPKFYDTCTGKPFPLSRYWYRFGDIYTVNDALSFYYKSEKGRVDNVVFDDRDATSKELAEARYLHNLSITDNESPFDLIFDE